MRRVQPGSGFLQAPEQGRELLRGPERRPGAEAEQIVQHRVQHRRIL